jgi:hypothetical protein
MTSPTYRLLTAALLTLSASAALAQASQSRSVGDFQMLQTSGAIDVVLRQGSQTTVKVEADSDVLPSIKTEVKGNKLVIYRDNSGSSLWSRITDSDKVKVYVTCPRLSSVEVSGASEVKSDTPFKADDFTIRASGASEVTLNLNVRNLNASASGASDLRLSGRAEYQQVHISGSSDYQAYGLQSQSAKVEASGASDAYVAVADELSSRSSGASDIHYKGNPRVRK